MSVLIIHYTLPSFSTQALSGPSPPPHSSALAPTHDYIDSQPEVFQPNSNLLTTQTGAQMDAVAANIQDEERSRNMALGVVPDNRF